MHNLFLHLNVLYDRDSSHLLVTNNFIERLPCQLPAGIPACYTAPSWAPTAVFSNWCRFLVVWSQTKLFLCPRMCPVHPLCILLLLRMPLHFALPSIFSFPFLTLSGSTYRFYNLFQKPFVQSIPMWSHLATHLL